MNVGIDVRPLLDPIKSGVGEYTGNFLDAIFKADINNRYFLFYNVWDKNLKKNLPEFNYPNVRWCDSRWPNKIFNFSGRLFGVPKFDKMIEKRLKIKLDLFFCLNFGFISLSKNLKKIVVAHDLSYLINPGWFSAKRNLWHKIINPEKYFKEADLIISVSNNTKRDLVDLYEIPEEKIKIIYPGIKFIEPQAEQSEKVKNKFNLPEKFILYLGTIEPRKNVLGVIRAFEQWQKNSQIAEDYYLVLAGAKGWISSDIWETVTDPPFKEKIKYLGYVTNEEKFSLYRQASLFLYPSFYEGFGFPPLEAMSCGTPVVASCNSSFPEVLGDAALLVNSYDINDIAGGIEAILGNDQIREQFVGRGLEQVKKFSWQKAAEEWVGLVDKL